MSLYVKINESLAGYVVEYLEEGLNGNLAGKNDGADELTGTSNADVIAAGKGNDTIKGLNGPDNLYGGDGDDAVYGGGGADWLYGGAAVTACMVRRETTRFMATCGNQRTPSTGRSSAIW